MKKIFVLLIALLFLAVFASCGKGGDEKTNAQSAQTSTEDVTGVSEQSSESHSESTDASAPSELETDAKQTGGSASSGKKSTAKNDNAATTGTPPKNNNTTSTKKNQGDGGTTTDTKPSGGGVTAVKGGDIDYGWY